MTDRSTATGRTLARTRWLSELAETLEMAGRVAHELGGEPAGGDGAEALRGQIRGLIAEVESLRRAAPAAPIDPHPDWMI